MSTKSSNRKTLYRVRIEAHRICFVEASTPERAAEIAEGDTRFGDLRPDGCDLAPLTGQAERDARSLGQILKE
jgi:hypothetical protein